jgi:hypothetical protein
MSIAPFVVSAGIASQHQGRTLDSAIYSSVYNTSRRHEREQFGVPMPAP